MSLSHLLFADDAIFFLKNNSDSIRGIKVLIIFQIISGLKVNFNKSTLYSCKDDISIIHWTRILGCSSGKFPFQYLGATVGGKPTKKSFRFPLIKKIKTKFAAWKCPSLSKAGRLVLIKAVINSIPSYWFSLNKLPSGVINKIEKIKRSFFW